MLNQTQVCSVADAKKYLPLSLKNDAEPKSPNRPLFTTSVVKIPQQSSQSHQLHEKLNHVSLATNMQSNKTIHVTIRSVNDIRQNNGNLSLPYSIDRSHQNGLEKHIVNRNSIGHPNNTMRSTDVTKGNLKQKQQENDCSANATEEKHIDTTSSTDNAAHHQKFIVNELITTNNFSDATMRNAGSDKTVSNKTRICFEKYCHCRLCLSVIAFLLVVLLVGIIIAVALLASLINSKTTTTSTSASVTTNLTTIEVSTTELVTTELITKSITTLTTTNETVYDVWNTTVGSDSIPATVGTGVGNYYTGQMANCAFDNTTTTKYTSFGICPMAGPNSLACGLNTGLYLTPQQGPSLLLALQFCTGNDLPDRDPLTITVEGSNQSSSLRTLGSSWTLIYNGSSGLQATLTRFACGTFQSVANNSIWYSSYRILVTSKRGVEIAAQYSELKLMGYQ